MYRYRMYLVHVYKYRMYLAHVYKYRDVFVCTIISSQNFIYNFGYFFIFHFKISDDKMETKENVRVSKSCKGSFDATKWKRKRIIIGD
jgi:hypothetical protein